MDFLQEVAAALAVEVRSRYIVATSTWAEVAQVEAIYQPPPILMTSIPLSLSTTARTP